VSILIAFPARPISERGVPTALLLDLMRFMIVTFGCICVMGMIGFRGSFQRPSETAHIGTNAFAKSITVAIRLSLFRFALCNNSFKTMSCSLHLFVYFIKPFWLSENICIFELVHWIVRAIKRVDNFIHTIGNRDRPQFPISSQWPFLSVRIVLASFHGLITIPLRKLALTMFFTKFSHSAPAPALFIIP
jgi:hypothetical protein